MPDILTDKRVKTRKPHRCWGCDRTIPAGSKMSLVEQVDGDGFMRTYCCATCDTYVIENDMMGEEIMQGELRTEDPQAWEATRVSVEEDDA